MASKFECEVEGCDKEYNNDNATIAWNLLDLHVRTRHPTVQGAAAAGNGPPSAPKLKIQRPSISERETESRWETFKYEWQNYKVYNNITQREKVVMELKQCCEARLGQKLLRDPEANHATEEEDGLLNRIKCSPSSLRAPTLTAVSSLR